MKPYKIVRTSAIDSFPGPVSQSRILGGYATLRGAIVAAREIERRSPDETTRIVLRGRVLRSRGLNGRIETWTDD